MSLLAGGERQRDITQHPLGRVLLAGYVAGNFAGIRGKEVVAGRVRALQVLAETVFRLGNAAGGYLDGIISVIAVIAPHENSQGIVFCRSSQMGNVYQRLGGVGTVSPAPVVGFVGHIACRYLVAEGCLFKVIKVLERGVEMPYFLEREGYVSRTGFTLIKGNVAVYSALVGREIDFGNFRLVNTLFKRGEVRFSVFSDNHPVGTVCRGIGQVHPTSPLHRRITRARLVLHPPLVGQDEVIELIHL